MTHYLPDARKCTLGYVHYSLSSKAVTVTEVVSISKDKDK